MMRPPKNFLKELVPGTDPNVDIVAIHGLNPKNKDSYAEQTWTASNGKLWLRDFLAPKLPSARILLFGYNSNVWRGANTMDIAHHADNLLNLLYHKRKDKHTRPLIFIAHSLGGLVVKQALVQTKSPSKVDDRYESIRNATYGIAFFATPHFGENYASFGKFLSDIINVASRNSRSMSVMDLQEESRFLAKLNEDFQQKLKAFKYTNFFETVPYGLLHNVIVDEKSARLGLASTREVALGIDKDHNSICKFRTEGAMYEQVENGILWLVKAAIASTTDEGLHHSPASGGTPGSRQTSFLTWGRQFSSPLMSFTGLSSTAVGEDNSRVFEVPRNKNPKFVGRQDVVQRVIGKLTSDEKQHRVALYGLGGVGKTDIAAQCAYAIEEGHPEVSVFWIQASSSELSHQSFTKIAKALQIPGSDTPDADVFDLVRNHLQRRDSGRWIVIIDHADDLENFKHFQPSVPDCWHGSVLLTTRNRKVPLATYFTDEDDLEEVPPLSVKESRELVHQLLDEKQYQDGGVDELTSLLNNFPLAIVQAASFIRRNSITLQTYLQSYVENKHDALELFGHGLKSSDDSDAVTTTWMMSFKQLQENNQYAADLLSLMAYLNYEKIPISLLRGFDDSKTPIEFQDACGELRAFSFATETKDYSKSTSGIHELDTKPRFFEIHPILQRVMQLWLRKHDQEKRWSDAALVAISKALPSMEISTEQWKTYEMYVPHVQAVWDHMEESTAEPLSKAVLLHNASWYYRVRGVHGNAARTAREAIAIRNEVLGPEDVATLASIHSMSRILFEQGNMEESEELQLPALEICRRKFGDESEDTLRYEGHLAAIRGVQRRYEEALALQERIREVSERTLGECPATWLAMRDLAITLSFIGHNHEAEALQLHVYSERRKHLGEDHPETLIIMSDLATTYMTSSRFSEAETLLTTILQHSKRVLGDKHPHTIAAYKDLKEALRGQGNMDHARRLDEALRRSQQERTESLNKASFRRRASVRRTISDTVITYAYQRSPVPQHNENEEGSLEWEGNGGDGFGLGLSHTQSETIPEVEEQEEDEEDGLEAKGFKVSDGLKILLKGVLGLPMMNIHVAEGPAPTYSSPAPTYSSSAPTYSLSAPTYSSQAPTYNSTAPIYNSTAPIYSSPAPTYSSLAPTYSSPVDAPQRRPSISLSFISSIHPTANEDTRDNPTQLQQTADPTLPRSSTVTTTSSEVSDMSEISGTSTYSSNKLVRSLEKKVERNLNKEKYDQVWNQSMNLLEESRSKWRKTSFKKASWVPGKKEKQNEDAGTPEPEGAAESEPEAESSRRGSND